MDIIKFYDTRWQTINSYLNEFVDPTDVRDPYIEIKKLNPIMIIGESPGGEETLKGQPFCGPAGRNLSYLIEQSGLNRQTDFLITNAFPFRTFQNGHNGKKNRTPTKEELKIGSKLLEQELKIIKPAIILLMGNSAKSSIKFIPELYNSIKNLERNSWETIEIFDFKTIITCTYHPSPLVFNQKIKADDLKFYFKNILPKLYVNFL